MGLIGGIARTAVIAGTATHVSNNVSRRQANRWAEKDQAAAAAAPAPVYAARRPRSTRRPRPRSTRHRLRSTRRPRRLPP